METARSPIHFAIQAAINCDREPASDDDHVVIGWVCVVESMTPDGGRWLSRLSADASGERRLARWTEQGLLHNGLYGDGDVGWQESDDDDDE
jgi:hypothetical protein